MEFLNLIDELYQSLFEPTDSICKLLMIKRCKYFLGLKDEDFLGDYYYQNIKAKEEGVVYTPEAIASYMIKGTVYEEEVLRNPFLRILDPSCGCGHILLPLFKYLKNIYMQNLQTINSTTGLNLNMDNIAEHIVKNNLFGVDIDSTSLKILSIELFLLSGYIEKDNMMRKDFITEDLEDKFNIVIGNPPYIGTKSIDKVY
ncbi:MAG: N-6 DNA methylase, partial [Bacillota bacterium]|nr:N-6 DNA methylase [Bacillota bacterium]